MHKLSNFGLWLLLCLPGSFAFGQSSIKGTVTESTKGTPLPGVNIIVKGTTFGTVSDAKGSFVLTVNQTPPFKLTVSSIGYHTEEVEVTDSQTSFDMKLNEESLLGQEVVVSASRVEENIMKSPVTIEKLNQLSFHQAAAPDYYDALANMKGVQVNNGSLNFTAVNTRGFATIANTRFVQWVDGMDTQAPLLNFPTGSIMALGELDAESIELIPGAASALYGPNAFNGIMVMKSKNPFEYQGFSAQVKQGVTNSNAGGSHPYGQYAFRFAHAFNQKLAFKANFSYMAATDWYSTDYKTDRNNPSSPTDLSHNSNFDGLNLYGDETQFQVPLPGPFGTLNLARTGIKEATLLDNRNATTLKYDAAVHYRLNSKMELSYTYRYGGGNSVYQGQAKYVLRDFNQQFHKIELKGDNFFIRGYVSGTAPGKSYNMDALGAFVNEAYSKTQTQWAPDYAGAYITTMLGGTAGVPGNNPTAANAAARIYADRFMIDPSTSNYVAGFQDTINAVRKRFFQKSPPGASFQDNSKLWHAETYYNFKQFKWAEVIAGGNFRQYSLFSNGTVFDEAPDNKSNPKRIFINQFGAYTQLSKTLINKVRLTGSIRYDKMDNFDGHFTPRFSAVYSPTEKHNIRASFQTGFRLPDTQAQYIYFPGASIILGGVSSEASRYNVYNGGSYTYSSVLAYQASGGTLKPDGTTSGGNVSLLQTSNLKYIKPEQLSSVEIGYKGIIGDLMIDANYYYNSYNNFLGQQYVVNKAPTAHQGTAIPAGTLWYPYNNSPYTYTSQGVGLGLTYNLPRHFVVSGNYNYTNFSGKEDTDFQSGFNTPKNRFSVSLGNRKLPMDFGFNINYRHQDNFLWESAYGTWNVPAYGVLDAQISKKLTAIKSMLKIGGTNLGGQDYRTNFGSPFIGQMYYVSITFDPKSFF